MTYEFESDITDDLVKSIVGQQVSIVVQSIQSSDQLAQEFGKFVNQVESVLKERIERSLVASGVDTKIAVEAKLNAQFKFKVNYEK